MRVLIACEFSGVVRSAFRSAGHDSYSCDLRHASDGDSHHYRCDVRDVIGHGWDLMIAHPPCTHLCSSGARWWSGRRKEQRDAISFCRELMGAPIPRICVENPIGILSTAVRKPDQIIHPWQYGHPETKATCLWLVGLPLLRSTNVVKPVGCRIHTMPPSADRSMLRSITYTGIAIAMANQWGGINGHSAHASGDG